MRIAYTQRVENVQSYHETRDCADRRLPQFLAACGFLPVPVPNEPGLLEEYWQELRLEGVFLTGGNSLVKYGGNSPERDAVDYWFLQKAVTKGVPVFGICRGMQSILDFFNVALYKVDGHVAVRHKVTLSKGESMMVNSYHTFAARAEEVVAPLQVFATSGDGIGEGICHTYLPIQGIMWHPERELEFTHMDVQMVKTFFNEGINR